MKHLVVYAHPNPESFCKGILDTVVQVSTDSGAEVRVRDLYQIGFDPILKGEDLMGYKRGSVPADIAEEQEHIRWADVITFVYPVWWAQFPAILKGYVDRVFSYGFAYEYVRGVLNGLLKGKKALLFCTIGMPGEEYEASGMNNSMKQTADESIFNFCGIYDVIHSIFGAVPYVPDEARQGYLKEVERIVQENLR